MEGAWSDSPCWKGWYGEGQDGKGSQPREMWARMAGQRDLQTALLWCRSSPCAAPQISLLKPLNRKRQMNKIEIICKEAVIEGYFNAAVLMASLFLLGKCVTN